MSEKIINQLAVPTWKWLQGNQVQLPWSNDQGACQITPKGKGQEISGGDGEYSTITQNYTAKSGESQSYLQWIHCEAGKNIEVNNIITVPQEGKVELIQVFYGEGKGRVLCQTKAECEKTGHFSLIQLMLGREDCYCDSEILLNGEESSYNMAVGAVTEAQILDMNVLVSHKEKKTTTDILVESILGEGGKKTFRGTIDFQQGACGAVGQEQENVLLLGDEVKNLSIPVILCGQEDVKGSHGAAIGELDQDTLFYLNSRGIDQKTGEKMMSQAKIQRVVQQIKDKDIATEIKTWTEEVFSHDG